jgi:tRNA G18 (ribose-2'-O)-methylase SpoU
MKKRSNDELERLDIEDFKKAKKLPCIVILDNVRSLNNIGSVFRTSDAFRIQAIYLCGITACPPHREIHKTALGATESVNWAYFEQTEEAIAKLKNEGYKVFAIEQAENSIPLSCFEIEDSQKTALIFGHEIKGVSQEVVNISDGCIEIPQYGTKHSLNVSVSAGIVIWEVFNRYDRF